MIPPKSIFLYKKKTGTAASAAAASIGTSGPGIHEGRECKEKTNKKQFS